ncbi:MULTISPECIES: fumarate hydratase [Flavobacteriaceae]|uniref:fumarate hydratase n=1 Tax=Flavobacteriaceae TaxID=49546 RepID=UPI0014925968|nr:MULTISPECIES: fumarate hydratase [Allomuricauda]MDC6364740.1 fumarate hydratase [Muricauda sp. AC10]
MKAAVISGDVIAFTSLSKIDKEILEGQLEILLKDLENYNIYARIIKGDYLEMVIPKYEHALRIALATKCLVKSSSTKMEKKEGRRVKYFISYGIRLAIGYGKLSRFDQQKGIIDGEAIYMSGRKINEEHTHSKERITIKNTLFFESNEERLNQIFAPIITLLDFIIYKATPKQCRIIYERLLGGNEDDISKKLNISQQTVNDQSLRSGWDAIEKSVLFFEKEIK